MSRRRNAPTVTLSRAASPAATGEAFDYGILTSPRTGRGLCAERVEVASNASR